VVAAAVCGRALRGSVRGYAFLRFAGVIRACKWIRRALRALPSVWA